MSARLKEKGKTKNKVSDIIRILKKAYPDARCSLNYGSREELLVAIILSAQCTDAMVNRVTPSLFSSFHVPEGLARAPLKEIERIIRPCGYYRQKARYIKGTCASIVESFGGKVPSNMEELLTLPGVARKTANVLLSVGFNINEGIAVDTHVARISKRLGLTRQQQQDKIERKLMQLIPKRYWGDYTNWLIAHGRAVCSAKHPKCNICPLAKLCPSAFSVA
ncbi:MAG: endonuclease III [Methanomassiliicoccales archaeon]